MKQWIGRQVVIHRYPPLTKLKGVLQKWDKSNRCVILGPQEISVPYEEIDQIECCSSKEHYMRPSTHPVGYLMLSKLQFDNAVLFQSSVNIWRHEQLVARDVHIKAHDDNGVVLSDGRRFSKKEYKFIVRSLRGKT